MSFQQKNNTGALFRSQKGDNPKRPDYRGTANVDGLDYNLSAWLQKSKKGETYMSLKLEPKEGQQRREPGSDDDLSDLPF